MSARKLRRALAVLGTAALAAGAGVQAMAQTPSTVKQDTNPNRSFYATDEAGNLLSFSARTTAVVSKRRIRGLPDGVSLKGLDFRPATGDLYGVGSNSVVYRVNPMTAIAVVEAGPFFPNLNGRFFGFDFNPTVDRIRVTSDFDQNIRLHPDDGNVVGNDADLNPGEPTVTGSAYTQSSFTEKRPVTTILYALDAGDDTLCVQDPPNAGTLTKCKDLAINVRGHAGFDIVGHRSASADTNVGYVATKGSSSGVAELYRLDLATGRTEALGQIGDGATITGLAAVQDIR